MDNITESQYQAIHDIAAIQEGYDKRFWKDLWRTLLKEDIVHNQDKIIKDEMMKQYYEDMDKKRNVKANQFWEQEGAKGEWKNNE